MHCKYELILGFYCFLHLPFKNTTITFLYTRRPRPRILYEVFVFIILQWWVHWSVSDDTFAKYLVLQKYLVQHFFCSSHGVKRQGKCSDFTREMCQDKIIPVEVRYNMSMVICQYECYSLKCSQEDRITSFLNFLSGFNWDMMVNLTPNSPLLPKKCL